MGIGFSARDFTLAAAALVAASIMPLGGASADTEVTLHSFGVGTLSANGSAPLAGLVMDGALPAADLIIDASGRLYGVTVEGGPTTGTSESFNGTVFALAPPAPPSTTWTHTIIHSFCPTGSSGRTDGYHPAIGAGLIMDASGNLYGTTQAGGGGPYKGGTVCKLTPNATKTIWTETIVHSFCNATYGGCSVAGGANPMAGVILDSAGNLYGTTNDAGNSVASDGVVLRGT